MELTSRVVDDRSGRDDDRHNETRGSDHCGPGVSIVLKDD